MHYTQRKDNGKYISNTSVKKGTFFFVGRELAERFCDKNDISYDKIQYKYNTYRVEL